jgi:hypothetical protein
MADRWNFGTPKKGQAPIKRNSLRTIRNGREWTGFWEQDGDKLLVCSAYGSRSEPIGRRTNLEARAVSLFAEILDHPDL